MKPKPTLKDIARLSETSPSTVSAVLSDTWRPRRISEALASRVRDVAAQQGYATNRQARGLRRGRSDMVGLLVPMHDNRFFAATAQSFEAEARARNLCPVVVSTLRDPREEVRTAERLISYAIDSLVIAGASDPAAVGAACRAAGVAHVFVDLPGPDAPSVVSDNRGGALALTLALLDRMAAPPDPGDLGDPRSRPHFLGGAPGDDATTRRIAGFRAGLAARGWPAEADQVVACGYRPSTARAAVAALCDRLGGLPAALFVNSLTVFEGVLTHLVTLPPAALEAAAIGCYDYDPIAGFLQFPVHMVRQDSAGLIAGAFRMLDGAVVDPLLVEVPPNLVPPRTLHAPPFDDLG